MVSAERVLGCWHMPPPQWKRKKRWKLLKTYFVHGSHFASSAVGRGQNVWYQSGNGRNERQHSSSSDAASSAGSNVTPSEGKWEREKCQRWKRRKHTFRRRLMCIRRVTQAQKLFAADEVLLAMRCALLRSRARAPARVCVCVCCAQRQAHCILTANFSPEIHFLIWL